MTRELALIFGSYLLGAVPIGYLIARVFYRVDIRTVGSGNPGATNVWRTLGAFPGAVTLLLDALKGFGPVMAARILFPGTDSLAVGCGMLAIVGHNWSIFLRGQGGKGVATSAGVFLGLLPGPTAVALLVFLLVLAATRRVSISSMIAAVALVAAAFVFPATSTLRWVVVAASAMVLIKHIPNIRRLRRGEEPRIGGGAAAPPHNQNV